MWHSQAELTEMFVRCIANGGNLLFNVGPYADGRLPELYKQRTKTMGEWIRRNADAVYGTRPAPFEFAYGGVMAQKDNRLFLFFLYWPGPEYSLPGFNENVLAARLLASDTPIGARQEPHRIVLSGMPENAPDICTVVELILDGPPTAHEWAKHRLHAFPMPPLAEWAKL